MVGFAPTQTRSDAIAALVSQFAAGGVETPLLDARVLVCAAAGLDHAALLRDPDALLGKAAARAAKYAKRRLAGEPVARILGYREFWSLKFKVTPDVLDPRADSEALVEAALQQLGARRNDPLRMLDLGTGSGALLAALLTEWPKAMGVGIDRSMEACAIARENLGALGLAGRSHVVCGDWGAALGPSRYDLIVSNPPYIETGVIPALDREVRGHDPVGALDGGVDGLDCYRALAPILPDLLAGDGFAILELGQGQAEAVSALMRAAGMRVVEMFHDLAGTARALVLGSGMAGPETLS